MTGSLSDLFQFASSAEIVAVWGGGFLVFALFAIIMDRRRLRRREINRVGFMPWTSLFVICAILGAGLLAAALPGMLGR